MFYETDNSVRKISCIHIEYEEYFANIVNPTKPLYGSSCYSLSISIPYETSTGVWGWDCCFFTLCRADQDEFTTLLYSVMMPRWSTHRSWSGEYHWNFVTDHYTSKRSYHRHGDGCIRLFHLWPHTHDRMASARRAPVEAAGGRQLAYRPVGPSVRPALAWRGAHGAHAKACHAKALHCL